MKWLSRGVVAALLTSGLLGIGNHASAAIVQVFSNNLAGWSAAAGGPVVIEDFADAVLVPGFSIIFGSGRPGTIAGGVYQDRADTTQAVKPVLNFTPGVTAFGADWDLSNPGGPGTGIALFLTFTDLSTQLVATEIPNSFTGQFFGIVSDTAILSIRLDEGTQSAIVAAVETFDADNVRFVVPNVVSEPTSLLLVGIGLAGLGALRRRKRA